MLEIKNDFVDLKGTVGRITKIPSKLELVFFGKDLKMIHIYRFDTEDEYYAVLQEIRKEIENGRKADGAF